MRTFNLSIICLTVLCFAQDIAADSDPFYQPCHAPIGRKIHDALRKDDSKEKRAMLEELYPHIERRIERYEELPFIAMAYRLSLLHVLINLNEERGALAAAREVVASYRDELDPDEFRAWLICVLVSYRHQGHRERIELLLRAASELGLSKEDLLSGMKTIDGSDTDSDGIPGIEDKCYCFDDRRDSDRDGVPDACDICWGHPDDADSDDDGFPDGCDLCPGHPDLDRDLDSVPDGCDNYVGNYNPMQPRPEHDRKHEPNCECIDPPYPTCCHQPHGYSVATPTHLASVTDRAGRVLESFEYNDFGERSKSIKWDGNGTPLTATTYEYNKYRELIGYTESPEDDQTQAIKTKVFRDKAGRYIGSITEGEPASNFNYYDKDSRILMVTTPTDPPEEARILRRFNRDEIGRVLKYEEFIRETGKLEVVSTNQYIENEDGSREVITRERINSNSERLTIEGFGKNGKRTWIKEYPKPISPRGTRPKKNPLVTRFEYRSEKATDGNCRNQSEWTIKILPSGVREVDGWRVEGEWYKKGSQRVFETYTTTEEEPRDSDKQDWTKRIDAYFEGSMYYTVEERVPSGAVVMFERDRHEPAYILTRREIDPSEHRDTTYRYEYNDAGRTIREDIESDDTKRTFTTDYDDRGRVLMRGTVSEAGTIEVHTRYDALDHIVMRFVVVHSHDFSMVLPRWSVRFAEADSPSVLTGHGWETLGVVTESACDVDQASVLIRRIRRDDSDAKPTQPRSLLRREFRALVEDGGGTIVGEPKKSTVTLCDGRKGRIESIDVASGKQGVTEAFWQLTVPATSDSEWSVMMTYTKPKVIEDGNPSCSHADFVLAYLSSFCPGRARLDVDATLLELSMLE